MKVHGEVINGHITSIVINLSKIIQRRYNKKMN